MERLTLAVKKYKEEMPIRDKERYWGAYANGGMDQLRTTWLKALDFDWSLLGVDAVDQVKKFEAEAVAKARKTLTPEEVIEKTPPALMVTTPIAETPAPVNPVEKAPDKEVEMMESVEGDANKMDSTATPTP